ncbi:hypothetical protein [Nonlabens sp.]
MIYISFVDVFIIYESVPFRFRESEIPTTLLNKTSSTSGKVLLELLT